MNLDQLTLEQLHGNQRELAETIGIEAYKRLVSVHTLLLYGVSLQDNLQSAL